MKLAIMNALYNLPMILFVENTGTDAVSKITSLIDTLYGYIKMVATPLGAVAIAFLAVKLYLSNDDQSARQTKHQLVVLVCGICLLYLAPSIISTIEGLFG